MAFGGGGGGFGGRGVFFQGLAGGSPPPVNSQPSTTQQPFVTTASAQGATERYEVRARGEMQLGVLIEGLRREGLEFSVSPPVVVFRWGGGYGSWLVFYALTC
jgi:GTP-binding protein